MELIRLERAVIGYRAPLFPPLDLAVRAGTTLGVLGPNGAGKSTLLKSMLGLLPLIEGRRELPLGRSPRVGYVPQRDKLDSSWPLSVLDVVLMGRTSLAGALKRFGAKDRKAGRDALAEIGIDHLADRPLHALSGGQHQRVLIARAIAAEPELVLLDLVTRLKQAHNLSVVLVTHQLTAIPGFATEVALVDRERQVFEVGPAAEMIDPVRLGRLYGRQVHVADVGGRTAVVVGAANGDTEPIAQPGRTP